MKVRREPLGGHLKSCQNGIFRSPRLSLCDNLQPGATHKRADGVRDNADIEGRHFGELSLEQLFCGVVHAWKLESGFEVSRTRPSLISTVEVKRFEI